MLAAASLLLSGKHAAPDDHVRFAQNNAFTEQKVSYHACTRALTTRVQPHAKPGPKLTLKPLTSGPQAQRAAVLRN